MATREHRATVQINAWKTPRDPGNHNAALAHDIPNNPQHTWSGDLNIEEYYENLRKGNETMQDIKQKFHISGIIVGMDAQVEVSPHQEPFVGGCTRIYVELIQNIAK